jgi:hypothetical protein
MVQLNKTSNRIFLKKLVVYDICEKWMAEKEKNEKINDA